MFVCCYLLLACLEDVMTTPILLYCGLVNGEIAAAASAAAAAVLSAAAAAEFER